jgi:3-phosphoshikimate 1-carboxyvinyltransferase
MDLMVASTQKLCGEMGNGARFNLPGDKSLSHRAALFSALALGHSSIRNFLDSGVTRAMLRAMTALGVEWSLEGTTLKVQGQGLHGLCVPEQALDCGNSATTIRLLAGALAASGVPAVLDGSAGLRKRPMERIVDPLREMGVPIQPSEQGTAPLALSGRPPERALLSRELTLAQASAQVKTCLLLAGLAADGQTVLHEPAPSRDHSERMLRAMGATIHQPDVLTVILEPLQRPLTALDMDLPGDFSAAAFLMVAALITPGSEVCLNNVGLNPGRTGLLDTLLEMGADIRTETLGEQNGEPLGNLIIKHSPLQAVSVSGDRVVQMIDEFPVFAVAAAYARGTTRVRDAQELRYKESDRISALAVQLDRLGVPVREHPDGFSIEGALQIPGGASVDCAGDHRLAMSLAVAGLAAQQPVNVKNAEMMNESFPQFTDVLQAMGGKVSWI